jgi:hypothetical protein
MKKMNNHSSFQYALIACLGATLLFGQMFKLHMHIQHSDDALNASVEYASAEHVVDVHVSSSLYNTIHDGHHQDDFLDHHNNTDIDISSSEFLKISKLLNLFIFLIFVASFILSVPLLQRICKKHISETNQAVRYYLLQPPLRAPPAI